MYKTISLLLMLMAMLPAVAVTTNIGSVQGTTMNILGNIVDEPIKVDVDIYRNVVRGVEITMGTEIVLTLSEPQRRELLALLDKYAEWSDAATANGHGLSKTVGTVNGVGYLKKNMIMTNEKGETILLIMISSAEGLENVMLFATTICKYGVQGDYYMHVLNRERAGKLINLLGDDAIKKVVAAKAEADRINDLYK